MKMRGLLGALKNPLRKMEYIYVPILMTSLKAADTLAAAATVRGIDREGERSRYCDEPFGTADLLVLIGAAVATLFLIWTNIQ